VDLCTVTTLSVTAQQGPSGSTHRSVILVFTNTGTVACEMKNYPAVALLDGGGQITQSAAEDDSGYLGGIRDPNAPDVTVAPGASASAMLESLATNQDGTSCTPPASMKINPPYDVQHSVTVAFVGDGCSTFEVHPVVPGTSGTQ
jgi:hypothetical protein